MRPMLLLGLLCCRLLRRHLKMHVRCPAYCSNNGGGNAFEPPPSAPAQKAHDHGLQTLCVQLCFSRRALRQHADKARGGQCCTHVDITSWLVF